ncbi:MAG: methanogen output domain 1-containing protein [Phycisphaeraceae bacterium]
MVDKSRTVNLSVLNVPLERESFFATLLRELSGCLQDVVGLAEAEGFVSVVGQRVGDRINGDYREALGQESLTREQVAAAMVDLKRRIDGDFYLIEENEKRLVFGNRRCPFGDAVIGRPALCMMTSNVFGVIASENLGFAKVELQETIAEGSAQCRVIVHLEPTVESERAPGRTYINSGGSAATES